MIHNDALRLDRLHVANFRCFTQCAVDLHPQLTVLVAENGRGKTALLDAIAVALGLLVNTISDAQQYGGFSNRDIRLARNNTRMIPQTPTELTAEGLVSGRQVLWRRVREGVGSRHRRTMDEAEDLRLAAQRFRDAVVD